GPAREVDAMGRVVDCGLAGDDADLPVGQVAAVGPARSERLAVREADPVEGGWRRPIHRADGQEGLRTAEGREASGRRRLHGVAEHGSRRPQEAAVRGPEAVEMAVLGGDEEYGVGSRYGDGDRTGPPALRRQRHDRWLPRRRSPEPARVALPDRMHG